MQWCHTKCKQKVNRKQKLLELLTRYLAHHWITSPTTLLPYYIDKSAKLPTHYTNRSC